MKTFFIALLWALIGASSFLYYDNTKKDLFLEYYRTENAVAVSPHDLKMEMDKGLKDTIIVDLRSKWEYDKEHIVGAISIPWIDATDKDAESQKSTFEAALTQAVSGLNINLHVKLWDSFLINLSLAFSLCIRGAFFTVWIK